MRKMLTILVAALALIGVGAVAVQADIPDALTGEITACRNGEHAVRIIDTDTSACETGESELSWLSNGGSAVEDHTVGAQSLPAMTGTVVSAIDVDAGRYIVTGKTVVQNLSGSATNVHCGLDGDPFNTTNETARATIPAGGYATLSLLATVDIGTGDTFEIACNSDATAQATRTVFTATSLSGIDAQ